MRVLHAWSNLLGSSDVRGDQGRHSKPRYRRSQGSARILPRRGSRAHEWQPLPLRRLLEYCRSNYRSRGKKIMKTFTYERAKSPAEAAASMARNPGAKFVAGGT